ncbi:MAG: malyl-CoA thiolesterase [Candidatus Rokubacteria bacterium RIFCSPLOWO2_12_FULL_71_22]|nr:MAG: malyl-CoA thiolesterase [Candidatus Rokubacteria bacterium RIFCSPLOWO2_12_FULL_71_22]
MTASVRPRRSVLFMPGSNTRAMAKAGALPADAVIFDLEDAVAPDAKERARGSVCAAARTGGYGLREVVVRVNGLATPWGRADLAAVATSGADAVLLPKVESPGAVREALAVLVAHEAPGGLALWCMLETPRGILHAAAIATASPRVAALVMGTSDLTKDLHARHTRDRLPLLTSLELCVLAARAAGVAALDGVHLDLEDDAGFEAACRLAADLGFDGKTLIHPRTIAKANEIFAPAPADVDWARRVIAAHAAATAEGRGVVLLDGRLIEGLHVEDARRLILLADAIEARARG